MLQNEMKKKLEPQYHNQRFLVPDLSPQARPQLKGVPIKIVFVGESPHVSEVEPDSLQQRRPLCGAAGRQWWSLLSEILEGKANPDVSLERQLFLCAQYHFAVLNAVQYPMDPKIAAVFPEADPIRNLSFGKLTGDYSYKKLKANPQVERAIRSLQDRLHNSALCHAPVFCLGNDSEWLVTRALSSAHAIDRLGEKIPHPSAWWRRGGEFGRIAKERLIRVFGKFYPVV